MVTLCISWLIAWHIGPGCATLVCDLGNYHPLVVVSIVLGRVEREIQLFLGKGPVLLCGDLNARTGTKLDYIPNDSRDAFLNLPNNYVPDPTTIRNRCNLDTKVNNFGKILLDMCIGKSLQIINGRTCGDFFGNFTCLKYNGNSTVQGCPQDFVRTYTK